MFKYILVYCFLSLVNVSLFGQNFQIIRGGEKVQNNFYKPINKFNIRKPHPGDFIEKTFYVKSKVKVELSQFTNYLNLKLKSYGYTDINIQEISNPFAKFVSSELLSSSSGNLGNVFKVNIENNYDIYDICSILSTESEIEYSVPVYNYKFSDFIPNDESLGSQYYLDSINIYKAWDIAKGDKSVIIGIVDSGTDFKHKDLISQIWVNNGEIPNDGIDNDKNGFIDDVNGWDFIGDITPLEAIQDKFVEDNNPIPSVQANDHGTHVAGISAAKTNNSIGIASTGFNVTFMPVKIAIDDLPSSRMVYRPYEGLLYAAKNGANIINCSWSSSYHDPLAWDVVNEVLSMGVTIVAASGNESFWIDMFPYYPAAIPGVIAVGSIGKSGNVSGFSNFGIRTNCFAPGENIYSTLNNDRFGIKSGTSMSSPVVAGFIANLISAFPNYTSSQIFHQIRSTTDNFKNSNILTHGKLNSFNAVRYNNSNFPAMTVPGLEVDEVLIENSGKIENYGSTNIRLKVRNYLSDAQNVTVNLSSQNDFLTLNPRTFNFPEIKKGQFVYIDLQVNINKTCPWFEGDAIILASFESGNYKDNQLIELPFKFESNNKYILVQTFPETYLIDWYGSTSSDLFNYWSVGYDYSTKRGVVYNFGKINGFVSPTSDTLIDVSSIDDNLVFTVSNGISGSTSLLKSTNGGLTFKTTNLSELLKKIQAVHFDSVMNGIITGINPNGDGKLLFTDDGGVTFKNKSLEKPLTGSEYFSSRITKRNNKTIFVATSKGKIAYSDNITSNFTMISDNSGLTIRRVIPVSKDTILYFGSNENEEYFLKITTNNGKSFSDVTPKNVDLSNVLDFFIPDSSNSIYYVLKTGEIYGSDDFAETWYPELNNQYRFDALTNAVNFSKNGKVRIWFAGIDISYLDYDLKPSNIIHNLAIAGKSSIDFDTLNLNTSKEEIIFIENKGNTKEILNSQILSNGTEFSISENFKNQISPAELTSATIKYNPKSIGRHNDTILITTSDSNINLKFTLTGFAIDPTSAKNSDNDYFEYNLSSDNNNYHLNISSSVIENIDIKFYDIEGNLLKNYGSFELNIGENRITLEKNDFPSGMYFLALSARNLTKTIKLIVVK
jgi:hypothetical protein